jgi:hypothetical protein
MAIATLIPTLAPKNDPIKDLGHVDNFNQKKNWYAKISNECHVMNQKVV